ncbi:hypothetical protein NEUTE1DRAFT_120840 [Neurospora tetrasperma FGSC 2508]|uniref:HTH CENPB-type domain-containing protein n=1 Tax=Neurospora tetrasperma (strain FGSC 2508 / ATCC MYA-4615 / P0657) TaxID=510951 RepID=F8MID4_NEUT8|nr:uncharacterized protein NEUTE1DRAFT_120840 [Neurospora tetrasperma FGSC 2508]EGO58938.1 hypothetical protein NEUTE1DRAFT_120840 [Neurospora tetrasperma FGSC 2508]
MTWLAASRSQLGQARELISEERKQPQTLFTAITTPPETSLTSHTRLLWITLNPEYSLVGVSDIRESGPSKDRQEGQQPLVRRARPPARFNRRTSGHCLIEDLTMSAVESEAATNANTTSNQNNNSSQNGSLSPPKERERNSLTLDQRRALRRWANSQTVRPSHKACIEWFQTQYNQTISQSTVSHSLSPKYARLDGDPQLSGSRLRFGNWPDVEKLVLLWHQQMVASGRQPSNEELAEKAKNIFTQLPRYKDETAPEFSPGWIHRFKKRYGLLIRRQRRHGTAPNPADDIPYLVDAVGRFMSITADVSPTVIRDTVVRVVGVEPTLATCARVRDEIVRKMEGPSPAPHHQQPNPHQNQHQQHLAGLQQQQQHPALNAVGDTPMGGFSPDDDPEVVLQNALRALQQEEADAEAEAAAAREERERAERGLPPLGTIAGQAYANAMSTPARGGGANGTTTGARFVPGATGVEDPLTLTPIPSGGPVSLTDRPVRCPFCVNQRMLRTIKEAVEHMSTHVVV